MMRDTLWPSMTKNITPAVTRKLINDIASYVDRNGDILLTLDMSQRYSFGDPDRAIVYDAVGVSENEMSAIIDQSKYIYKSNRVQCNPFYELCTELTGWYLKNNDEKSAIIVFTYMSLMMVTSIHKGLFKYGCSSEIWQYTIAHLDNTYAIRNFPSMYAFIQDNSKTVVSTYKAKLIRGDDKDITYVIDANWTRLKGKMKKIAGKYYENHQAGRYLNQDSDSYDTEDFHQMDNVSFAADRLVNRIYIKMINHQYDRRLIKFAMDRTETSYQKTATLIDDIITNDGTDGEVRKMIDSVIKFYVTNSGRPISYVAKGDFITYMRTSFGSNTTSGEMDVIKSIIDRWLAENMYKYGRAKYGKTVQTMYRRVIYMFFVWTINYEAKLQ